MQHMHDLGTVELARLAELRQGRATSRGAHGGLRLAPVLPEPCEPVPADSSLTCPICKGVGYIRRSVAVGHPYFGKALPCSCQQARKNASRRKRLWELSQLEQFSAFADATFSSFREDVAGVQQAYEAALQFAQTPSGWLVFVGGNGCGKTHLAVAIARSCLQEGATVLFAVVADLLAWLRATFAPDAETPYDELFERMRGAEVLILDDLGAEQSTPWAQAQLFQLLNHRYNRRLPTVITTNLVGFVGLDPRLRSRLSDRRLVKVVQMHEAEDFRLLTDEQDERLAQHERFPLSVSDERGK